MAITQAEYIWLDGVKPTHELRSKTRIVNFDDTPSIEDFPEWGFDGSSTQQAEGNDSDCILKPVRFVHDPIRGEGNYLVLCEVYSKDHSPHPSNTRAQLRKVLDAGANNHDPLFGFEQEYTLFESANSPLGWPENGFRQPQGPFYCGVGARRVDGRDLVEAHTDACIEAGLLIFGTNAEVMLGQWEYQIGYRGFDNEIADPLTVSDHMWIAAWLLHRLGEEYGITANFENKPIKGDWNGAGCHTNFSTKEMRDPSTGKATIDTVIDRLSKRHTEHILIYGNRLHERLTGDHETCHITDFKYGVSNRGASIRIPLAVDQKGHGYLEDRRPGANSDPYLVAARILTTICDIDESVFTYSINHIEAPAT
ncbi:MAG: glutamine synthetase [Actinobacteria bacterium]|nr:glutamine synthetase [Actinomycetota bacterium]